MIGLLLWSVVLPFTSSAELVETDLTLSFCSRYSLAAIGLGSFELPAVSTMIDSCGTLLFISGCFVIVSSAVGAIVFGPFASFATLCDGESNDVDASFSTISSSSTMGEHENEGIGGFNFFVESLLWSRRLRRVFLDDNLPVPTRARLLLESFDFDDMAKALLRDDVSTIIVDCSPR